MEKIRTLSIGDRVEITKEGAYAHQQHHDNYVSAVTTVTKTSMPFVGTVVESAKKIIFTFPEPNCKGSVVERRERWWGQPGHDYLIEWDDHSGQSWHLSKHLLLAE